MLPFMLSLAAVAALVAVNAFFVASEFAMVKVRPTQLEPLAAKGNRRAKIALGITHRVDSYLSANRLGITLASLALGWVGEPVFARLFGPVLALTGLAPATRHSAATALGFALLTFLHVVMGELAPKSVAIQRTESVALWTAAPLRAFYAVAFPVIWLFNAASGLVVRLFGMRAVAEAERMHSAEELRLMLKDAEIAAGPRRLIDRVFDYTNRVARHVMTPRRDVVVFAQGAPVEASVRAALATKYSRFPVVDPAGRVVGFVHFKDLVDAMLAPGGATRIDALLREHVLVDPDRPLDELRREFLRRNVHLAAVTDGAGAFLGIVTLEDLLEQFVGNIRDEQDEGEVPRLAPLDDGRAVDADARLTLDVLARDVGLAPPEVPPHVETLGGLVRAMNHGRLRRGATFDAGSHRLTVLEVRDGRAARVRLERLAPAEVPAPSPPLSGMPSEAPAP